MKYTIIIFILILSISCSSKKFVTSFYITKTDKPEQVIDSINKANNHIGVNNYNDWNKTYYISNDSNIVTSYFNISSNKDATYIFTINQNNNDSIVIFKFRKE